MRTLRRFALLPLVIGATLALSAPPDPARPPQADVPPPPGINDPGVATAPSRAQGASQDAAPGSSADPLAPLPKPDTRIVRNRVDRDPEVQRRMAASEHVTREQGDDTVEEYRQNGRVWMLRIQPRNGPVETFMDTTGNGRLTRDPQQGPVAPVYFSLYEWN